MTSPLNQKKYTQKQLTKIFISQLNAGSIKDLHYKIWYNPTDENSLRLTLEGLRFLISELKLKSYEFELETPLKNKHLIQLERYFQSVYYLMKKKIIVFDEEEAVMLSLHANDLPTYLKNLESTS